MVTGHTHREFGEVNEHVVFEICLRTDVQMCALFEKLHTPISCRPKYRYKLTCDM